MICTGHPGAHVGSPTPSVGMGMGSRFTGRENKGAEGDYQKATPCRAHACRVARPVHGRSGIEFPEERHDFHNSQAGHLLAPVERSPDSYSAHNS